MQYIRLPRRPNSCPEYEYFWTGHLPRKSTRNQLAVLLDELAGRYGSLLSEDGAHGLPVFFLSAGCPRTSWPDFFGYPGMRVDLTRLFHWLGPAAHAGDWTYDPDLGREESQDIRRWLESRPSAWKTLLAMGLKGCSDRSECDQPYGFASCMAQGRAWQALRCPTAVGLRSLVASTRRSSLKTRMLPSGS